MVKVRTPATSANLGAGFDCYGMAWDLYNEVAVQEADRTTITIEGEGADTLPTDRSNLLITAMTRYYTAIGRPMPELAVHQRNRIPVMSGLGSSSATIVAGLLAANALCGDLFSRRQLLDMAAAIEGHPDNVAPALLGGLVVGAMDGDRLVTITLPVPPHIRAVVFVPRFGMSTEKARAILPASIPRHDAIFNLSRSALFVAAMMSGDLSLLREAMRDRLHQPYRQVMFPAMPDLIRVAEEAGAQGACLSGAGPTIMALVSGREKEVSRALQMEADRQGIEGRVMVMNVSPIGAHVSV